MSRSHTTGMEIANTLNGQVRIELAGLTPSIPRNKTNNDAIGRDKWHKVSWRTIRGASEHHYGKSSPKEEGGNVMNGTEDDEDDDDDEPLTRTAGSNGPRLSELSDHLTEKGVLQSDSPLSPKSKASLANT